MILYFALCSAWAASVSVEEVLEKALARDPEVVAAEADLQTARGDAASARGLRENPTVSGSVGFGIPQYEIAISQPISVTGEGIADVAAAKEKIKAAEARLIRRRLEGGARIRKMLVDVIVSEDEAQLTRIALDSTIELRKAVEAQVVVGNAPEVDAQLARLTETSVLGEWLAAIRVRDEARISLLTLADLPLEAEFPSDPLLAAPTPATETTPRHDVVASSHQVDAAKSTVTRASAAILPPISLGFRAQWQNVGVTPGLDGVIVPSWDDRNVGVTFGPSLSMVLPIWHRNEGGRAKAKAELHLAETEHVLTETRAEFELGSLAQRRKDVNTTLETIPAWNPDDAKDARKSIQKAYSEGQLSGLDAISWFERIGNAEYAALNTQRELALWTIDQALIEEWSTLIPSP